MIFLDSNIPMYVIGGAHPNKLRAQLMIERFTAQRARLVTDAEVYQEILHRYLSIGRRNDIQAAYEVLDGLVDAVLAIERADLELAKNLVATHDGLSARDAVHVGVMRRVEAVRIASFDRGFDRIAGLERLDG